MKKNTQLQEQENANPRNTQLSKGDKTMNNKFPNLSVEFKNKNIAVMLTLDPEARFHNVAKPWRSAAIMNAVTHILVGTYKTFEEGMYLKYASLDEVFDTMGDENIGYVNGVRLVELVEAGKVHRNREIQPKEIYRLMYDGMNIISAAQLIWVPWVENESPNITWNRNAIELVSNFDWLFKAVRNNVNLSLNFPEDSTMIYEEKKLQYQLYLDGKIDELKAHVNEGVQNARAKKTLNRYTHMAEEAVENGTPFVLKDEAHYLDTMGEEHPARELLGRVIRYHSGETTLKMEIPVTEDNLSAVIQTMKKCRLSVVFVDAPETTKVARRTRKSAGRNVLLPA